MTISMDKQYRTRDGREVRIYAVDGGADNDLIHGAVKDVTGWDLFVWRHTGCYKWDCSESEHDLIEVKPRIQRELWMNVYHKCTGVGHETKESADQAHAVNGEPRLACVKITIDCEEGEGL